MELQIDSKAVLLVVGILQPLCLLADTTHVPEATETPVTLGVDKGDMRQEAGQLRQTIEMARAREQTIKKRNEELHKQMQELESRISELKGTLLQEEAGEGNEVK